MVYHANPYHLDGIMNDVILFIFWCWLYKLDHVRTTIPCLKEALMLLQRSFYCESFSSFPFHLDVAMVQSSWASLICHHVLLSQLAANTTKLPLLICHSGMMLAINFIVTACYHNMPITNFMNFPYECFMVLPIDTPQRQSQRQKENNSTHQEIIIVWIQRHYQRRRRDGLW